MDGVIRPMVLAHQVEIVRHQRTRKRMIEVTFQLKPAIFDPAIRNLNGESRVGVAAYSYRITVRKAYFAFDDEAFLSLGTSRKGTQEERDD